MSSGMPSIAGLPAPGRSPSHPQLNTFVTLNAGPQ